MTGIIVKKQTITAISLCISLFVGCRMAVSAQSGRDTHLAIEPAGPNSVHYVGLQGSDSYEGSENRPWATFQHADAAAKPGDTVVILDGKYPGDIILESSGTPNNPITYRAKNKWAAKIVGMGVGAGSAAIGLKGGYTVVQDLDITGSDANGIILALSGSIANHNQAVGNYVHDLVVPCNSDSGTAIESGAGDSYVGISHNDMIGNVVVNITPFGGCPGGHQASGLFAQTPYSVIANNIVINAGYGIQCWHAARNVAIVGNILLNNLRSITVGAGDAPYGVINDHTLVQNNIIVHSVSLAIAETGKTGRRNRYIDNLIYGGNTTVDLNNGLVATGTVNGKPQFINNTGTAGGDYRLRETSPGRWPLMSLTDARAEIGATNVADANTQLVVPAAGISADAGSVRRGEFVTLKWTTKNAVRAILNGERVPLSGSLKVQPKADTTYKLIATSPTGATDWGAVSVLVRR